RSATVEDSRATLILAGILRGIGGRFVCGFLGRWDPLGGGGGGNNARRGGRGRNTARSRDTRIPDSDDGDDVCQTAADGNQADEKRAAAELLPGDQATSRWAEHR